MTIQVKAGPITGDGNLSRFNLRVEPDRIYLSDGRAVPSRYHAPHGVDDTQLVIEVHCGLDDGKGFLGTMGRVDVE